VAANPCANRRRVTPFVAIVCVLSLLLAISFSWERLKIVSRSPRRRYEQGCLRALLSDANQ
jgi:hypothetical protein